MKKRNDFVTNSSSSSFIVVFKDEKEKEDALKEVLNHYPNYVGRIFQDIENNKIDFEKAVEIFKNEIEDEVWYRLAYQENYREKGYEYLFSDEFKEIVNEKTKAEIEEFKNNIKNYGIISYVEYSDNDGSDDAELEHYIMPALFFTYMSFNHH